MDLKVNKKSILAFITALVLLTSVAPASADVDTSADVSASDATSSTPHTISTFDSSVGADVIQNPEINNNIPRTDLSNEILEKQKQGSTIVQFGNGNGNKLLIWAGIHGNEEEANIATMNYVDYLNEYSKSHVIDGTLYVIPFAIPKDTAVNSRDFGPIPYTYTAWVPYKKGWYKKAIVKWYKKSYRVKKKRYYKWVKKVTCKRAYGWLYKPVPKTGYKYDDPNRIADVPGTPGWNVLEYAKNNGINHILDVHSGGGLTGPSYANGLVYASPGYSEEGNWANYVKSHTGSVITYSSENEGTVRLSGHKYGINTITLEVERDGGTTSHYAGVEFNMIKAACQYMFPQLT